MGQSRRTWQSLFSLTLLLCSASMSLTAEKPYRTISTASDSAEDPVDANLTVYARYPTILEMQWEIFADDLIALCRFEINHLGDLDFQDCITSSSNPKRHNGNFLLARDSSYHDSPERMMGVNPYQNVFQAENTARNIPSRIKMKDGRRRSMSRFSEKTHWNHEEISAVSDLQVALSPRRPKADPPTVQQFFNITGLEACTRYDLTLAISALSDSEGGSGHQYISEFKPVSTLLDETEPPKSLHCDCFEDQVKCSWDPPFDDCKPSYYSTSWIATSLWSEAYENDTDVGPETNLQLDSPLIWAEYNVFVSAAYNDSLSESANIACRTPEQKPTAVQNVSVEAVWSDTIWVTWDAPVEANGNISLYVIYIENVKKAAVMTQNVSAEATSYNITGLDVCANYSISIVAVNGAGEGPSSEPISQTLDGSGELEFTLSCSADDTSVSVQWNSVYRDCEEVSYHLQYSTNVLWENEVTTSDVMQLESPNFTITDENFIPGTIYNVTVSTVDELSDSCSVRSPDAASSAPAIIEVSATHVSIYVAWNPPVKANGVLSSYKVTFTDENNVTTYESVPSTATSLNSTEEILGCMHYSVDVAAVNSFGLGNESTSEVSTVAVLDVACVVRSSSEIYLSWNLTDNGVCTEKELNLTWTGTSLWEDSTSFHNSTLVRGQDENKLVAGLHPYTEYIFDLVDEVDSKYILRAECTTWEAAPTPPQMLSVKYVGTSSVTLSWEEPESWNGTPLGYNLKCGEESFNVTGQEISVIHLKEKTRYQVCLDACNSAGCSTDACTFATTTKEKANTTVIVLSVMAVFLALGLGVGAFVYFRIKRREPESPPSIPPPRDYSLRKPSQADTVEQDTQTCYSEIDYSLNFFPHDERPGNEYNLDEYPGREYSRKSV